MTRLPRNLWAFQVLAAGALSLEWVFVGVVQLVGLARERARTSFANLTDSEEQQ